MSPRVNWATSLQDRNDNGTTLRIGTSDSKPTGRHTLFLSKRQNFRRRTHWDRSRAESTFVGSSIPSVSDMRREILDSHNPGTSSPTCFRSVSAPRLRKPEAPKSRSPATRVRTYRGGGQPVPSNTGSLDLPVGEVQPEDQFEGSESGSKTLELLETSSTNAATAADGASHNQLASPEVETAMRPREIATELNQEHSDMRPLSEAAQVSSHGRTTPHHALDVFVPGSQPYVRPSTVSAQMSQSYKPLLAS